MRTIMSLWRLGTRGHAQIGRSDPNANEIARLPGGHRHGNGQNKSSCDCVVTEQLRQGQACGADRVIRHTVVDIEHARPEIRSRIDSRWKNDVVDDAVPLEISIGSEYG